MVTDNRKLLYYVHKYRQLYIYIYIYIYMCVCVCVFVCEIYVHEK